MAPPPGTELVLSDREYYALRTLVRKHFSDNAQIDPEAEPAQPRKDDFNLAAFRSASRVYLTINLSLKTLDGLLNRISNRNALATPKPRKPLVASRTRLALSIGSLLFFHRILFRLFSRLRLQLLHEKVQSIKLRYPRVYAALTSKLAPAIGASLSGLALGISPSDQLRVTIAIYIASRACELAYGCAEGLGKFKNKPWWFGSWLLFPLAQGQLLHAFVFDRDCFPPAYGSFILNHTPEYVQPRPEGLSSKVQWPSSDQIVDSLANMASLKWPSFVSPILHPSNPNTLPATINQVISPITSRAHPALQHLSCALLHPSETSCFIAYLKQNFLSFPSLARFFTLYYGALSLLRIRQFIKSPIPSVNRLAQQILRTTVAISGAIGVSWGSICLFANILPRSLLPKSRFFLGGLLGGMFQIVDRTAAGHANAMYASRTSVDSLWKVGVKRRWWRPIKGGDVWLFVACVAVYNVVYDLGRDTEVSKDRSMSIVKLLRGEIEVGLQQEKKADAATEKVGKTE